jgi:hypothetical protein
LDSSLRAPERPLRVRVSAGLAARSLTSGAWTVPCTHSPIAKALVTRAKSAVAAVPLKFDATSAVSVWEAAQIGPSTKSRRIRRRPSASRAIGSCATTITTVFAKKTRPTPRSPNRQLSPNTAMNTRWRTMSR